MKHKKTKWGVDVFPSISEILDAERRGMSPDEYCKALNDAEEYERQLEEEAEARGTEAPTDEY